MLTKSEILLKGIPSSSGVARGKAYIIAPEAFVNLIDKIEPEKIPDELIRFDNAIDAVAAEYQQVLEKVTEQPHNVVNVLETNLFILADSVLIDAIKKRIESGLSAETSIVNEFDQLKLFLKNAKDPILRERSTELDHIRDRLLASMRNSCIFYAIEPGSIVIAQSVSPSDLVKFKESGVAAIVTEVGGITSHSSILARTFEIPEVIGVKDAVAAISEGEIVIVDGFSGTVRTNPSEESEQKYEIKKNRLEEHRQKLGEVLKLPTETLDGRSIRLLANVDFPEDVEHAIVNGAEGIGLVRTEHLFMNEGRFSDEEFQYKWYKDIAERAYPYTVTFRVFDLGGDKFTEGIARHENNPALGFRGIRVLLKRTDIFETQVRAILRASANKNLRLMLPMICSMKEIKDSISFINHCKEQLENERLDYDHKIPIGIMIETPAAAMLSDEFASMVDFFSIGTNDLTQYTLAADRTNELMTDIFDAFHPSILRLIKMTVENAVKYGIPVSLCGELASHSAATGLLIGLGVEELSVAPSLILSIKKRIRDSVYSDSVDIAKLAIVCSNHDAVMEKLHQAVQN